MRLDLYQIMDTVAGHVTGPIIVASNDAVATRMLRNTVTDPQSDLRKNVRDFNLIHIGYQDEKTGALTTEEIRTVITGSQLLAVLETLTDSK